MSSNTILRGVYTGIVRCLVVRGGTFSYSDMSRSDRLLDIQGLHFGKALLPLCADKGNRSKIFEAFAEYTSRCLVAPALE